MNIREIEIFRTVMQEGSVSKAAERLRVSQPAVSKYIAQLEQRLGLSLFLRRGGRIVPTPEANALFGQVDRLFLGLGQVERFMDDLAGLRRGHLTIACLPLLSLVVMPDVVAAFTKERPDISVALQTRSSARIVEWVAARQVDVGVGLYASRSAGVVAEPLVELELFCAIPPGDLLETREVVDITDLEGRDLITLSNYDRSQIALEALLDRYKISPRRRIEVFWTSVALELAVRGVGIAFVDRLTASRVAAGAITLRRFQPSLSLDVHLIWPEHWVPSAITRTFAEGLRTHLDRTLTATPPA
jgi:DNA-binding transcriptional LysR family regulator